MFQPGRYRYIGSVRSSSFNAQVSTSPSIDAPGEARILLLCLGQTGSISVFHIGIVFFIIWCPLPASGSENVIICNKAEDELYESTLPNSLIHHYLNLTSLTTQFSTRSIQKQINLKLRCVDLFNVFYN